MDFAKEFSRGECKKTTSWCVVDKTENFPGGSALCNASPIPFKISPLKKSRASRHLALKRTKRDPADVKLHNPDSSPHVSRSIFNPADNVAGKGIIALRDLYDYHLSAVFRAGDKKAA